MKQIDARVTQEDIDAGWRRDPVSCPLARAAKRALEEQGVEGTVRVYPSNIVFQHNNITAWCDTSGAEYRFIKRFDKGKKVEPFGFSFFVHEGEQDLGRLDHRRSGPDLSR